MGYLCSGSSLALCLRGGKCCKQAAGCAGPRCLVTVDPSWRGSFIQWHLWSVRGSTSAHCYTIKKCIAMCATAPVYYAKPFELPSTCLTAPYDETACNQFNRIRITSESFFPGGLCCTETSAMRREQVCTLYHTFHPRATNGKHPAFVLGVSRQDTQRALGPVGLCGARTKLHSGPGGPGEGFTFKGIGTRHRSRPLVWFAFGGKTILLC